MSVTISTLEGNITSGNDAQVLENIDTLVGQSPSPFTTDNLTSLINSCESSTNVLLQTLAKAFLKFIQESLIPDPRPTERRDATVGRDPLLLWACDKSMPNMAAALLNAGANPNVADVNGDTPLLVACDRSLVPVAIQLINNGAIGTTNRSNSTPNSICTRVGNSMNSVILMLNSQMLGDVIVFAENDKDMYITSNSPRYTLNITKVINKNNDIFRQRETFTVNNLLKLYTLKQIALTPDEYTVYQAVKQILVNHKYTDLNNLKELLTSAVNSITDFSTTPIPVRGWTKKASTGGGRRLRLKRAAE